MKNMIALVVFLSGSVFAQTPTVEELEAQIQALQDSIVQIQMEEAAEVEEKELRAPTSMKAQLFGRLHITEYVGEFGFERVQNGATTVVRGHFRLDTNLRMTLLKVNGVEIFRDYSNPRPAVLPANNVGSVRNFYAYLAAHQDGQVVAWSWSNNQYLQDDEGVNFILQLARQPHILEFSSEHVEGQDLTVWVNGGQVGYYDTEIGAFRIWLDPNLGVVEYQIRHQWTGEILQVGELSPVDDPEVAEGHVMNISLDDGIEVVDLIGNNNQYFYREFPGQEEVGDVIVPVKVFILEREEGADTYLDLDGFHGDFVVKIHRDQGEMEPLLVQEGSYGEYTIPAGPEKLIVIFYRNEDIDGKFSASFYTGEGGMG